LDHVGPTPKEHESVPSRSTSRCTGKKKEKKSRQLSLPQAKTLAFDGNTYYVIYHGYWLAYILRPEEVKNYM
jgi:hypothetical protein